MHLRCFVLTVLYILSSFAQSNPDQLETDEDNHLTPYLDYENGLLIVATLDGSLFGVNQKSGDIRWSSKSEPAVKVFTRQKNALSPVFLPDPKDGSLYLLNVEETFGLSKLPFSIQQLVADSPTKSHDGIFYFGKKHDSWISIDNKTGEKKVLFSTEDFENICPVQSPNIFFIGRTEYNLGLIDSKRNNDNWNITYYDYSARALPGDQLSKYGHVHAAGSASGRVRTFNRYSGSFQWERDFGSPMVSLYLQWGRDIFSIPFTTAAESSLDLLPSEGMRKTLFIGEHNYGLYALPSLTDSEVPILTDMLHPTRYLLGGPENNELPSDAFLGHYNIPLTPKVPLRIAGKLKAKQIIYSNENNNTKYKKSNDELGFQWVSYNQILFAFLACVLITLAVCIIHLMKQVREIKQSSQGSNNSQPVHFSNYNIQQGIITVGKISFDTQKVLGKGCEGTFVFQGEFDGREVAVKRLLPECFTIADREVQLLRESDSHSNVVRYFSTEQDSQFRYIALELCSATLQDYVEKGVFKEEISFVDVLKQATLGLEHLHSLKIVHRDIKPHNILLTSGNKDCKVRAMISDFGLCKKLPQGRNSFSKKSGITGTEGWIAPEMMNSSGRVMSAVDIFSLGCVFYYTISGIHPFGDSLRRQSNILLGVFEISQISDELWKTLISNMINPNPTERPSAEIVKNHPVFWDKSTILTFLQDVSDRVDKENVESPVLQELEKGGDALHKNDWKQHIHAEIAEDIGKYRTYRGDSVRDLLRAFRNKRHHYRDLSKEAQDILGVSAESYVDYWLSRFPSLLFHVWSSMQAIRSEPCFIPYYDVSYTFPRRDSDFVPEWIFEQKFWAQHFSKKKTRSSPVKKNKPKSVKVSSQGDDEVESAGINDWIKAGEKTGAWRPRNVRRASEEKNVAWKLPS